MKEQKFSERLKEARIRRGLSQVDLAREVGVSDGAVGNWESDRNPPSPAKLRKIAEILSVPIDYLRGTLASYVINDSPAVPYSTGRVQTQVRTKCHQYLDELMDSFKDDEDKLRWLYIELKRHFPINSTQLSEAQQLAKKASDSLGGDPSK